MKKIFAWLTQNHAWQKIGMLVVLGIAVHLILPQITALQNSWQVLTSMILWAVGLAFLAQIFSYLGSGYMLQSILAIAHQKVSLWLDTLIVLGSYSIGMVAGGVIGSSAAIYQWTSGGKGSMEGATLASIFLPQFNTIILVLVSIFGLIHLLLVHSLTQAELIGFGVTLLILGLIIGGAALAVRFRDQATKVIVWISSRVVRLRRKSFDPHTTQQQANDIFGAWDALWHGAWHQPVVGAFLNVAFDMLTLYFLFIAAGEKVSMSVLLAGYGLPLLLGKVAFIIPGGVGVVESSMAALYTGLGVPQATTVVVVLGYRLISFWMTSLAGFPIAAYLQRSQSRSPQNQEAQDLIR
ncbi:MAG: YbhN family protein [Anaerolineales bacterium]